VFAAVAERSPQAYADLATLTAPGGWVCLFAPDVEVPPGWSEQDRIPCGQLVAEHVRTDGESEGLVTLGPADVPDMLALVEATQPGPFGPRTIELGGYVGLRDDDGSLVAMAGHRLRCDGYVEVSAVCTAKSQQGKGLGTRMVRAVVESIRAGGDEAFLHVADHNVNAYRLYLALGFVERCKSAATIIRLPSK
jgi:ribosomal protein S18 acetylase RimI-like enzyme